jgi:hypothetical protein
MGQHDSNTSSKTSIDFEALAQGVDEMREVMRSMVAGLVADGFDDAQARDIVAGLWRTLGKKNTEDEG